MNRFFSLDLQTRVKVTSIENSWYSTIIQQMYFQSNAMTGGKKLRYKIINFEPPLNNEDFLTFQKMMRSPYNELNIESFFVVSEISNTDHKNEMIEDIFLNDVRFISINDNNDTLILSSHFVSNEQNFQIHLNSLSNNKIFSTYCK